MLCCIVKRKQYLEKLRQINHLDFFKTSSNEEILKSFFNKNCKRVDKPEDKEQKWESSEKENMYVD